MPRGRNALARSRVRRQLGTLAATRVLQNLLYGVSPTDPVALAGACIVLLIVAAIASWLPARQAAVIDPMEALRRD